MCTPPAIRARVVRRGENLQRSSAGGKSMGIGEGRAVPVHSGESLNRGPPRGENFIFEEGQG